MSKMTEDNKNKLQYDIQAIIAKIILELKDKNLENKITLIPSEELLKREGYIESLEEENKLLTRLFEAYAEFSAAYSLYETTQASRKIKEIYNEIRITRFKRSQLKDK